MKKKGLIIKKMREDGACLFRAVADQIFGDEEMHGIIRKQCMDYVVSTIINLKLLVDHNYIYYMSFHIKC